MAHGIVAMLMVLTSVTAAPGESPLNPALQTYVAARTAEFDQIPNERRQELRAIATYVRGQLDAGGPARLTFICTHNSRRSHFAQIWAATAAAQFGIRGVETFSGGTEATAFNPRSVAALRRAGFDIPAPASRSNPRYVVRFGTAGPPLECFSKVYSDEPNPTADFCAVMTCSQADENCPVVQGSSKRISLPFDDPKAFDDTSEEAAKYDERCRQIAREMLYAFSLVRP